MSERRQRLHDHLDGELSDAEERELLAAVEDDPELSTELSALRELREDLGGLPRPETPGERLTDAVMAALPPPTTQRSSRGFWQLFNVRVPAWAVLLLVLGFGALLFWQSQSERGAVAPERLAKQLATPATRPASVPMHREAPVRRVAAHVSACKPQRVPVRFILHAPKARAVSVAGDFNSWKRDGTVLADDNGNGVWTVTIFLTPGRYQYKFVVDGKWVVDPDAPGYHVDGFGGRNAVLSI